MKHIILLHGALGSKEQMKTLQTELSNQYNVHVPDLPGHGTKADESNPLSLDRMSQFLNEYMLSEKLENPSVFGYSMGGYVALYHALLFPKKIQKIITLATKFDWSPEIAKQETNPLDPDIMISKIPDFVSLLIQRHGESWKQVISNTKHLMLQLGDTKPLNENSLAKIETPCLLCIGDKDRMVSQNETKNTSSLLLNATMNVLLNTTHPYERIDITVIANTISSFVD